MKKLQKKFAAIRATDGARTRGLDLGKVARYQLRHCRISHYQIICHNHVADIRATDGARTRGLDLGKVARYQLRHCRIHVSSLQNTCYIITDVRESVNSFSCRKRKNIVFENFHALFLTLFI